MKKTGGGVLKAELPDHIFTISSRDVTKEMTDDEPRKYIDALSMNNDGVLEISAHIYRRRMNISDCSEQEISAFLFDELTGHIIPVDVYSEKKTKLTEQVGKTIDVDSGKQVNYNYDGTGFKIIVDLVKTEIINEKFACYKVLVKYKNRFSQGKVFLGGCDKGIVDANQNLTVVKDNSVARIKFSYMDELQIFLKKEEVLVQEISVGDGQICCILNNDVQDLWMEEENGEERIYYQPLDRRKFCIKKGVFKPCVEYYIHIKKQNSEETQLLCARRAITIYESEDFAIVQKSTTTSALRLQLLERITYIKKIENLNGKVTLWTRSAGSIDIISKNIAVKLCVDDKIAQKQIVLAKTQCIGECRQIECKFEIDFNNDMITKDFYQSVRNIYIEYELADDSLRSENLYSPKYFKEKIEFETLEIQLYRSPAGIIRMKLVQLWKAEENSRKKREKLTFKNYPEYREKPIEAKRILFESMWGSKYSCNPQALYEYIDSNYPEYECIWSLVDARTPIKGRGKRVRRGSQEYYYYLATSKYFVNNVNFEAGYVKRKGQIEIQTMHGTPLKTLGLDVPGDFPTQQSREEFINKNKRWDYLVVQGTFVRQKAKSMFECTSKIITTGYPRTDKLFAFSDSEVVNLKRRLHLPTDRKIILYAPTWRVRNRFDMMLDLDKMKNMLSEKYVLLIRLHHLAASGYIVPEDKNFIFDFTLYQCIEDLYNIADILITDYSSVMFDYALLNKPMIFYVYDIEEYGENLRGMYVDFRNEAPGPLAYSTDELIKMLLDIDNETAKCKNKIKRFKKKYLTYEKGNSCQLIMKKVFQPRFAERFWRIRQS